MTKARYFTVSQKARVRNRLLDRRFEPIRQQQDQEQAEVAQAIWDALYPAAVQARMDELPDGWLPLANSVGLFEAGSRGTYVSWPLMSPTRHPARDRLVSERGSLPASVVARADRVTADIAERKTQRRQLERELDALLGTFRTVERAIERWPEAADVIRDVVGDSKPSQLPATTKLNELLDLPPEQKEAA